MSIFRGNISITGLGDTNIVIQDLMNIKYFLEDLNKHFLFSNVKGDENILLMTFIEGEITNRIKINEVFTEFDDDFSINVEEDILRDKRVIQICENWKNRIPNLKIEISYEEIDDEFMEIQIYTTCEMEYKNGNLKILNFLPSKTNITYGIKKLTDAEKESMFVFFGIEDFDEVLNK